MVGWTSFLEEVVRNAPTNVSNRGRLILLQSQVSSGSSMAHSGVVEETDIASCWGFVCSESTSRLLVPLAAAFYFLSSVDGTRMYWFRCLVVWAAHAAYFRLS